MLKNIFTIAGFLCLCISMFFASMTFAKQKQDDRPYIVTTTSQIGDLVRNVVGDSAHVDYLMGTDIDPHLYHPKRSDMTKLMAADIVIYNGMNLEGKMEGVLREIGKTKPFLSAAESLALESLRSLDGEEGYDPHIWMNVHNWVDVADDVRALLSENFPDLKAEFNENTAGYVQDLHKLDKEIRALLSSIPDERRTLVTAHDAFGYLGAEYGLDVVGIQGISTESEAGLFKIKETVDLLVDHQIPAVFVESSVGDQNIRAIIEGAQARNHTVRIGGMLFSDAMGAEGTVEGTYIGMMRHNARIIAAGLGGQDAAEHGALVD